MDNVDPPLDKAYKTLLDNHHNFGPNENSCLLLEYEEESSELPMIDLSRLDLGEVEYGRCIRDMARAASHWGFFQVLNHGIPQEIIDRVFDENIKIFRQPFSRKGQGNFLNPSAGSRYRWGNSRATSPVHFMWSEAFHISVAEIGGINGEHKSFRSAIEDYSRHVQTLAQRICMLLGMELGIKSGYFLENCLPSAGCSFFRMNRYPECRFSSQVLGMIPHSDSDFLTIVFQDHIGGLQVKKDGRWLDVKPCREALTINIGDLFQALSNGVYKSLEHRVVAPRDAERFSLAFFLCPSHQTIIQSCAETPNYKKFSFGEYTQQVKRDVDATGNKVGLSRFLV